MPDDVEGALTLCGAMECLHTPMVAFVRLAQGTKFKNCLEVPIPVRFVIVILVSSPLKCTKLSKYPSFGIQQNFLKRNVLLNYDTDFWIFINL